LEEIKNFVFEKNPATIEEWHVAVKHTVEVLGLKIRKEL